MSLAVVSKKIEQIYQKGIAEESDIRDLIKAAERSKKGKSDGVSNAEARAVADFFVRIKTGLATKAVPPVQVSDTGLKMLNSFFVAHHLPYGINARPMMELVASVLRNVATQGQLDEKPRTGSLQPLRIDNEQVAYVDAVKKQFVVKKPEGFYGPFELPRPAESA